MLANHNTMHRLAQPIIPIQNGFQQAPCRLLRHLTLILQTITIDTDKKETLMQPLLLRLVGTDSLQCSNTAPVILDSMMAASSESSSMAGTQI